MPRNRLDNRRDSRLIDFEHNGSAFVVGYSLNAAGALAELFISGSKTGSERDALGNDGAILASLCLQHGIEAAELTRSLGRHQGFERPSQPASAIGAALDAALADMTKEFAEDAAE